MTKRLILSFLLLVLGACESPQLTVVEPEHSAKRKFETAIAAAVLRDIRTEFSSLLENERLPYLKDKLSRLDRSVNFDLVDRRTRREREILVYLVASEEASSSDDLLISLRRLTSLTWELNEFHTRIVAELERQDRLIADLHRRLNPDQTFDLKSHMSQVRDKAVYPLDNVAGRQAYLDQLADDMITAQLDWYDTLESYEPTEIGFEGFEDEHAHHVFRYAYPTLAINLSRVDALPLFETAALAVYYGFPGMHSLMSATRPDSIQHLLKLPGFAHGWAAYIADYAGARETNAPLNHVYHGRLLTALALVDFNLHTARWQAADAVAFLHDTTPYTESRLQKMVAEIRADPGLYVSIQAGKLTFAELHDTCLELNDECSTAGYHQAVVEGGPMPFRLLRARLLSIN